MIYSSTCLYHLFGLHKINNSASCCFIKGLDVFVKVSYNKGAIFDEYKSSLKKPTTFVNITNKMFFALSSSVSPKLSESKSQLHHIQLFPLRRE